MLPLWWPRTACVYCGRRIPSMQAGGVKQARVGVLRAHLLACDRHAALVPADPLLQP